MAEYDGSIRIGTGIDTSGFDEDGKELEAKAKRLGKSLSNSVEIKVKADASGAGKEFEKVFEDIEKEEKRIEKLSEKVIRQPEEIKIPQISEKARPYTPGYDQSVIEYIENFEKQSEELIKVDEHYNQLKIDVEEYAKSIKDLQAQGKFFGDEEYDRVYLAWKNATDAVKAYQTELNKQTASGQAKIAEQEAKAAERKEAAQCKAEEQAERALQKENTRIQKEIENQAKLEAKEAERQARIQAEAAEEERLNQIRVNAVAANDEIIAKVERIKQLEQEIADLKTVERTEGYSDYDNRIAELSKLKKDVKEYSNSLSDIPKRFSIMRAAAQKAFDSIRSGLSAVGNIGKKAFSSIWGTAKKAFSGMASMAKRAFSAITSGSKQSNASLSGGLKTILKYSLGIRSFYALFSKIRTGIQTGFTNLMGYSDGFANSIQSVKNSMSTLGNQIAAAFAPIVQMVIPWLNQLISALSTAMSYVAQFIAAITGKGTFTKAKQVQNSYNKSLGGTAAAAKKAYGALAKFDDLDVLQKQEDDTGAGGAAGAMGGLFEEVPISDKFKDIVQWLKEMWENSDFYELGKLLGEKLKEALDSIPWDEIKEIARKIGKSIATFINGFIEVEGLGESIGRTLAEAFNTGFEFLNSFVHNLHWESIGKFIAETINGFFTNIDWNLIYDTFITGAKGLGDAINSFVDYLDWESISKAISNFFNTFIDTVYTFITTIDWEEVGEKVGKAISDAWTGIDWKKTGETVGEAFKAFFDFIATAIENVDWWAVGESVKDFLVGIDWAGVAESFFETVGAAIGGLAAFLGGLIGEGVEDAKQYFEDKIEEAGGNVVEGILVGISEALVNIGEWIKQHVFQPFIDGFKEAFGIHSPSTVMAEMGGYLMEGLINGIEDTWNTLKDTISEIWEEVKTAWSDTWESIKRTVLEIFNSIKTKITDKFNEIKTRFNDFKTAASETWTNLWEGLKKKVDEIITFIKEGIADKFAEIEIKFSNFKSNATDIWAQLWDGIKTKVSDIVESIKDTIKSFFDWISKKMGAILGLFTDVGGKASGLAGGLGGAIGGIISGNTPAAASLSMNNIPMLASGAVIRGGNPFMAILGDQPAGRTNIEAPLATIEQAVENVLNRQGYRQETVPVNINLNYDGETFARLSISDILSELGRQGYDVDVLGVT